MYLFPPEFCLPWKSPPLLPFPVEHGKYVFPLPLPLSGDTTPAYFYTSHVWPNGLSYIEYPKSREPYRPPFFYQALMMVTPAPLFPIHNQVSFFNFFWIFPCTIQKSLSPFTSIIRLKLTGTPIFPPIPDTRSFLPFLLRIRVLKASIQTPFEIMFKAHQMGVTNFQQMPLHEILLSFSFFTPKPFFCDSFELKTSFPACLSKTSLPLRHHPFNIPKAFWNVWLLYVPLFDNMVLHRTNSLPLPFF